MSNQKSKQIETIEASLVKLTYEELLLAKGHYAATNLNLAKELGRLKHEVKFQQHQINITNHFHNNAIKEIRKLKNKLGPR